MTVQSSQSKQSSATVISFAEARALRFFRSDEFGSMLRECAALKDATNAYFEREGKQEEEALSRNLTYLYENECMRLKTRLAIVDAWIVKHYSAAHGVMSLAEARRYGKKDASLLATGVDISKLTEFSLKFRSLIARSIDLAVNVMHREAEYFS